MLSQLTAPEIFPGLTISSAMDGQVICLTPVTFSADTIDTLLNAIKQIEDNRPDDTVLYCMVDFSKNFAAFLTPYGRQRLDQYMSARAEIPAYWAFVLPENFVNVVASVIARQLTGKGLTTKIFSNRDRAMQWLEQVMGEKA